MPRLTLIYPCIGRFPRSRYVRSWQLQPLAIAVLAGMTPPEWSVTFFDDRLEPIDFDAPADLAAISIETFTARRGYQIAAEYRRRGVPVVFGGYHATFCPDEALEHGDAVCVGEAEGVWSRILADAAAGRMHGRYERTDQYDMSGIRPDRRVFEGKNYFSVGLVETGRGCPFACNFCSVSAFHRATYRRRPIPEIVEELRAMKSRLVFFVDDNMVGDTENAKELFRALTPLGIQWVSQASINVAQDEELLRLMVESGCVGLLIGFESLEPKNLAAMKKKINRIEQYSERLRRLRRAGIAIYGTFVFGYPNDTEELCGRTVDFALDEKLFLAAFANVLAFPGTPLYKDAVDNGRLRYDRWWLDDRYRFGQVPFHPEGQSATEIEERCHQARRRYLSTGAILRRGMDWQANCRGLRKTITFYSLNFLLQREIDQKRGTPLGVRDVPERQ